MYMLMAGIISRPVVRPDIQRLTKNGNKLIFYCDFDPSSDTTLLYQVTWYRDRIEAENTVNMSIPALYDSRENIRSLTFLSEEIITLGMTVISNGTLRLQNLAETLVHIRLTVPFACQFQSEECFLGVNMFFTETGADDCLLPAAAALSNCGVRISSLKWNESYPVRIVPIHGQNLISISRYYNIRFRTDLKFDHDFFRNYTLPRFIQVEVTTDASNLNGKECHAICDPHMQTFDGWYYENQNEGTYVLYRHLKSLVQIQMRTNPCFGFQEGPPFCPCGVAIAAGRDVFVVDRCSIPIKIYMPLCDDGILQGKIECCWPREDYLCICKQYQDGNSFQSNKCSPDSRKFCPESALNDSLASECRIKVSEETNAEIELDPSDFNVSQSENVTTMETQTKINFTENSANHECWSYLNSSLLFEKCSKVPDIDPKSFAKTCANDALITKTMFWAPTHMDNAQKRCIYQVTVNQPLPGEMITKYNVTLNAGEQTNNKTLNENGLETSVSLQELKDLACPMNCSNHGKCFKGQCHCNKGYGSDDCSVDLTQPPDVYGIPKRGVCDLRETSCNDISVLGNNFADSTNIFCRLSLFQVKANDTIFHDNISLVLNGKWISFAEVSCPLKDVRSKRSVQFPDDLDTLAIGYRVAVGNTRDIFGRNISLLVVDSECVDCIKAGFDITCTLKDGFDLINRRCNKTMSTDKKEESGSTVLIISSVLGSVLVVIVVGGLLYYCIVVRPRRAQKEKERRDRSYAELQEMEKRKEYYGTVEVYDAINDLPDDYSTIHDSVLTGNEPKDSEMNYVKLGNTQKNAAEGYSYLNKLRNNEYESEAFKYFSKEQGTFTGEANIHYQMRPLPTTYDK
ncbi:hypothetical protein CHS0354_015031 [Potamilus streckersoni]|uniref:VWFD domain-containing protein n=1 Tax=Potamilus streckersoni TaxID=2493646 RepID=A0AAE0TG95_9BIVA|nr:hypothetical protein CHS0354_015031 [Potamilus streckersoni]